MFSSMLGKYMSTAVNITQQPTQLDFSPFNKKEEEKENCFQ
jgi:hypothetical protein